MEALPVDYYYYYCYYYHCYCYYGGLPVDGLVTDPLVAQDGNAAPAPVVHLD